MQDLSTTFFIVFTFLFFYHPFTYHKVAILIIKYISQTANLKVSGLSKKVPGSTRYANDKTKKVFTPSDWQQFSESNLTLASSQIKRCLEMQSGVDGVLAATASALKSQKDFTDRAFRYLKSKTC